MKIKISLYIALPEIWPEKKRALHFPKITCSKLLWIKHIFYNKVFFKYLTPQHFGNCGFEQQFLNKEILFPRIKSFLGKCNLPYFWHQFSNIRLLIFLLHFKEPVIVSEFIAPFNKKILFSAHITVGSNTITGKNKHCKHTS